MTDEILSRLCEAATERPANAYLLAGGHDATMGAARRLAAALMRVEDDAEQAEAVLRGTHVDLDELHPAGAGVYLTRQVEEDVVPTALRAPMQAPRRVIVLYGADRLGAVVASALLKTIEEPPATTSFVLCAVDSASVLDTIVSRCVVHSVPPLPADAAGAALETELGCDPVRAAHLVAATGSIDVARLLLSDPEWEARRRFWLEVPKRLEDDTFAAVIQEIEDDLGAARASFDAGHASEREELDEHLGGAMRGIKGHARMRQRAIKDLEERQKREARNRATADRRLLLVTLAGWSRDVMAHIVGAPVLNPEVVDTTRDVATRRSLRDVLRVLRTLQEASDALDLNANGELVVADAVLQVRRLVA
ncbi:MAG: hypothetical protein IT198_00275 [Acidimicrobiia bacterium]|nr:hypothetical protein [Acidimicrobiia bacterium]